MIGSSEGEGSVQGEEVSPENLVEIGLRIRQGVVLAAPGLVQGEFLL